MNEETLFQRALELPESERASFLERECPDPILRAQVERLLAADAEDAAEAVDAAAVADAENVADGDRPDPLSHSVDSPKTILGKTLDQPLSSNEQVGTLIAGRYKLLQKIAEGGMGSVWMAEQTEPVKRKVAVKLIRADRGQSKTILARFEAEQQAIALMDHPHIAKLLDAGTTDSGQPFFVMELVKGVPLLSYCDQQKLSIPERLRLFIQICSAVQHAHQKGIIHRDLKPGNILVESHDDKPVPKVIDFGLAKAVTGLQLTEQSLFTGFGTVLGTPLYMAPEQACFNSTDIDTRADVYALGVILYELLTGSTPLNREAIKKAALDEMLRLVREEEAPSPSTRLSSAEDTPSIAAQRGAEPVKLIRMVRGELDWIVLKALSKERDRRYETANSFAQDIERFLNHEPVQAGPPSASYRLKKFVRRNRPQVIAGLLIGGALVAGIIGTTIGLLEARQQAKHAQQEAIAKEQALIEEAKQRQLAEQNEQKAKQQEETAKAEATAKEIALQGEKKARQAEEKEKIFAQAIADFVKYDFLALTSVEGQFRFGGSGSTSLSRNTTLIDLLNRAAEKLKSRKDLDPRIEAELCWIVGVNYRAVSEPEKGIPYLERAVELRQKIFGPHHEETLTAMNSLAVCLSGAGLKQKSLVLQSETFELCEQKLGKNHSTTLTSLYNLALVYHDLGQIEKALPLYEQMISRCQAKYGKEHPQTLISLNGLAMAYESLGQMDKALPLYEETFRIRKEKLGPEHPETLVSLGNLGNAYMEVGQIDKGLTINQDVFQLSLKILGPEHSETLRRMGQLAFSYHVKGDSEKALSYYEDCLRLTQKILGSKHHDTLVCMNNLAFAYRESFQLDKAIKLFEEALDLCKTELGPDHPDTLVSMNGLGIAYKHARQFDKALPLLQETLKLRQKKLGQEHPETIRSIGNLALVYHNLGKLPEALNLYEQGLKLARKKWGPTHPDTLTISNNLATYYQQIREFKKALPIWIETLQHTKEKLGPENPTTLSSMNNLATCYIQLKQFDQAIPLLEETVKLRKVKLGETHPNTLTSMNNLARAYQETNHLDKALPLYEKTLKLRKEKLGERHPQTITSMNNLALAYKAMGKTDQGLPLLEEAFRLSSLEFGENDPETVSLLSNLATFYLELKQEKKAAELLVKYVNGIRKQYPKDSPYFSAILTSVGFDLLKCQQYETAEQFLRESIVIREKTVPNSWTTFDTISMLGEALLGQKKYAHAEPLLLKGYQGLQEQEKKIPPQAKDRIIESLDRLIELYTLTTKPEEVEKYKQLKEQFLKPKK